MGYGIIKQIVIVTDGHANAGCSPVEAARVAAAGGVTVSAIGILDGGQLGARGQREVEAIAAAGGGMANCVATPDLSRTLHAVTWQTTQCTLNVIINRELKKIAGVSWTELPPEKRGGVIDMMTGLADNIDLQMMLLLDTSASMTGKMPALLHSVQDLILTLQERKGRTHVLAARFPGRQQTLEILTNNAKQEFQWKNLRPEGRTPTGPAILEAVQMLSRPAAALPKNDRRRPLLDIVI